MSWNGAIIKEKAREMSRTITDLSHAIGVSRQTVDSWIKGQIPRGQHLIKLCKELETSPSSFFTPEKEYLVSVPQHRTVRRKKVTDEMQAASKEMAEQYINLFRSAPSSSLVRVIRASRRDDENAKRLSAQLRRLSGIDDDRPMDFEHAFYLLAELGIYTIFRPFPEETSKDIYAFYSKICEQRVIFVNTDTNIIDFIFQLLHETIHAIRDEEPDKFNEVEEEDFCDSVANYIQFPDEYVATVSRAIEGCSEGVAVNKLKKFAMEHAHSLFGISKRLKQFDSAFSINVAGADTNLKKVLPRVRDILFDKGDARKYIETLCELSPGFIDLVTKQSPNTSLRKLAEWLGLDNTLDAKEVMSELRRIGEGS